MAGGRDQREPMERLVRLAMALQASGTVGMPAGELVKVAGFTGGKDPITQLGREFRHMRELGWDIENIGGQGEAGRYRMTTVDNRLRLKLTLGQQAALRRAAVLANRDDLAQRLGLAADSTPAPVASPASLPEGDLATVIRALRDSCLLRFRYKGTARVVHPESVRTQNGTWYLHGLEEGGTATKNFVVSRMADVGADPPGSATRPVVTRHPRLHPMSWEVDPPIEVTLRAPQEHAADVRRWLGDPERETTGANGTELVYRVTHRAALRSRLYELGSRVTVVGPPEVRQEILGELAFLAGEA